MNIFGLVQQVLRKISIFLLSLILATLAACTPARVPVPPGTIPPEPELSPNSREVGRQMREQLISEYDVERQGPNQKRVRAILDRLLQAAGAKQEWTLTVFRAPEVENAAATQGNNVFVWTGILSATKEDAEVAAVLGHEMAHVLAGHVVEDEAESTNKTIAGVAGAAVGAVLSSQGYGMASDLGSSVTEATVKGLIVNPYSQELELEADHIGMFIMADAGYNPEAAINFWKRSMETADEGFSFFSTHPSSSNRMESLQSLLPQASERYELSKKKSVSTKRKKK